MLSCVIKYFSSFLIYDMNLKLQFKPLEQLMGVFPAASKKHLPITWQTLMDDPVSISYI